MICPFAERRGAIVYCRVLRKRVNPLAYPCLSKKYEKCKIYQEQRKFTEERTKELEKTEKTVSSAPIETELRRKRIGIRLDGSPARTCKECIYYGRTGLCLLLGIEVKDPNNPPCRT